MPDNVITPAAMNRAVLARQSLLGRSTASIPRVLEAVAGLQMQYAPSGYLGLWSRMELGDRRALTSALHRHTVLQGTLMRATIHLVSRRDYPLMAAAVRSSRRAWWLPRAGSDFDPARLSETVRRALTRGPLRRGELVEAVKHAGFSPESWEGVGLWVDLIREPPGGTWERRRADLYALADLVVPPCDDEQRALDFLLRRYLTAFGPAPASDAARWAGVPLDLIIDSIGRLRLRRMTDTHGDELLDAPRAPLPDAATPAPVRFLPTWDTVLLTHARRSGILPEDYRPLVFANQNPPSVPTFLVDGRVVGTWRFQDGRITLSPFETVPPRFADELEQERRALEAFHT